MSSSSGSRAHALCQRYRCIRDSRWSPGEPIPALSTQRAWTATGVSRVPETAVHPAVARRGSRSFPDSSLHRDRRDYGQVSPLVPGRRPQTCRFRRPKPQSADPGRQADQSDQSRPRGAYGQKHNITVRSLVTRPSANAKFRLAYDRSSLYTFSQAFSQFWGWSIFRGGDHNAKDCRLYSWSSVVSAGGLATGEQQYGEGKLFAISTRPWCRKRPSRSPIPPRMWRAAQLTNDSGVYVFPGTFPGPYRLTAEAPGMQKYEGDSHRSDAAGCDD